MGEKKRIKIEDKNLKLLVDKMLGLRLLLDDLALRKGEITKAFWERAAKLYGLDLEKKFYRLLPMTYEIEEE